RPERRDGQPRVVARIRRHRGAREPRRDLPAAHAGGDRARGRGPAAARLVPPGLAMGRSLALFTYKMRFFFGPALRGRFGPLAYLMADLAFQFVSLLAAAGLAAGVAAVAMVLVAGRSIVAAVPLFGVFALYVAFVLLTSQVFVILRIRFPKVPVRLLTLPVIGLSLLPALGVAVPGLPIRFDELPLPSIAFAALGLAVLRATPPSLPDVAVAAAYLVAIAGVWLTYSKTYIFHGLKPTLTAGFGPVDFRSRMEMQRPIVA